MRTSILWLLAVAFLPAACVSAEREIDRRCSNGDCVVLLAVNRRVVARRLGEFSGERKIGSLAQQAAPLVGPTEAPILYATTPTGWRAVVSAFLPLEFDYNAPELRLCIVDPLGKRRTAVDEYNILGSFHMGRIFGTDHEFVQISTTGAHAYMVRTRMWLLPRDDAPIIVLDIPGTLERIQSSGAGQSAGVWISREMYDGVHSETKCTKQEFWVWNDTTRTLTLNEAR